MEPHGILTLYSTKALEYLVAVVYLLLFVPFWRFVNGGPGAHEAAASPRPEPAARGLFALPDALAFHPGHTWVRMEDGQATVGLDDFAHKLVGPRARAELPAVGDRLVQGEPAWRLSMDGRSVDVLAPLSGEVVEVNRTRADAPNLAADDPYGAGWLLRLRPSRPVSDLKQLMAGDLARRWLEGVERALWRIRPELGLLLQDGGQPVFGIARELDPEGWERVAGELLLS
jgi:glycine cleavage system H lipoate-binding protein